MTGELIFGALVVVGLVWTAIWVWVVRGAGRESSYAAIYERAGRLRWRLFYVLATVGFVALVASLWALPYPAVRALATAQPALKVEVTGVQWGWDLSRTEVPAGVPVEFRVAAADVNHNFALYDDRGRLVAQVQAMPGYTNRLIHTFDRPGTYTVRCLELCGTFHHLMVSEIAVAAREAADGKPR